MKYIKVNKIIFRGRQNIQWKDVADYLKSFQGKSYKVNENNDLIHINFTTIEAYTGSRYTWKLKGSLAKVKANIVQIIPEMIENASNRRWVENNSEKHNNNASKGWYRYDTFFSVPVQSEDEVRWNDYRATLIVRINDRGLYLYDIINIKKEASNPR